MKGQWICFLVLFCGGALTGFGVGELPPLNAEGTANAQISSDFLFMNEQDPEETQATDSRCKAAPHDAYKNLCNRYSTPDGRLQCFEAGVNRYFDQCSLDLCNRFKTEPGATRCLVSSRDKNYSRSEIATCHRFALEKDVIRCLNIFGEWVDEDPLQEVREEIEFALDLMDAGKNRQATRVLEDLLEDL